MSEAPARILVCPASIGDWSNGEWDDGDGGTCLHYDLAEPYTLDDLVEARIAEAVAKERERCAKVAESGVPTSLRPFAASQGAVEMRIAAAIREGE